MKISAVGGDNVLCRVRRYGTYVRRFVLVLDWAVLKILVLRVRSGFARCPCPKQLRQRNARWDGNNEINSHYATRICFTEVTGETNPAILSGGLYKVNIAPGWKFFRDSPARRREKDRRIDTCRTVWFGGGDNVATGLMIRLSRRDNVTVAIGALAATDAS